MDRQRRGCGTGRGGRGHQPYRCVGPHQLVRLSHWITDYEATDLMLHLDSLQFVNLLETREKIDSKLMVEILKALAKCIQSHSQVLLNRFLGEISAKTFSFRLHVNEYLYELENEIMSLPDDSSDFKIMIEPKLHSIHDLLVTLKKLLCLFPNQMCVVSTQLSTLTKRIQQIHHKKKLSDKVLELLMDVESEIDELKVRKAPGNEGISEPPNDFRLIPVIPTVDDIQNKYPFLRKNIVDHGYRDVYHYLDTHFRLMREDFIRPLRCGIIDYLKAAAAGHRLHRLQGAFIYHNVRVEEIKLSENCLLIRLKLDLLTMPKVNWNTSRRLMFGSLICFSCKKFDDFIIGTIGGYREPELLKRGHFEALIDPLHESKFLTSINESPDELFVVIEPLSYFEAYRHILKSLQDFTEDSFPLKKYIVNMETKLNYPDYLSEESRYNFTSFHSHIPENDGINVGGRRKLRELSEVNVLKTETWPPSKEFGMDESQYNAMKDALTREVSVIQGPPGTGKTYIGLRVVETLMMNTEIWDEDGTNTILVTCYTNHALDQFMEGIDPFCKSLLRIGGRCRSNTLQKYCLRYLKRNFVDVPNYILEPIYECQNGMYALKRSINDVLRRISQSRQKVLPPLEVMDVIRSEINENQANSLMSIGEQRGYTNEDTDAPSFIKIWLGFYLIDELKLDDKVEEVDDDEEEVKRIEDERGANEEVASDTDDSNENIEIEILSPCERKFQEYFSRQINCNDVMDIETARQVVDVTLLELEDRWRLYRLWVKLYIARFTKDAKTFEETKDAAELRERLEALRIEEVLRVAKDVKIIGATTTGAAKNRSLIRRLKPKIVIVEEAAEILESHIITSLTEDTKHLILIGDHIQLQPNSTVYDLAVNYNLNVSLFERLIRNNLSFSKLKIQHRMHPNISELLVPLFYSELENHEIVTKYESIRGVTQNLFFVGHTNVETVVGETKSRYNAFEVDFVYRLCKHLLLQGYQSSQITVLTMYSAQMFRIRNAMRSTKICCDVRVSAVDNFQGEENDIIICSFVRSNLEGEIGFLKTGNRVNVAISRARKGFYAIGNFDKMAEVSKDVWRLLLQKLKKRGFYGYALELYCQNHTETKLIASKPSDFDLFPKGCCLEPCNKRLNCGHVCSKWCHLYDVDHQQTVCNEECLLVTCEKGHRCSKVCHFPRKCGRCSFPVEKKRYCGHTQKLQCWRNVDDSICYAFCEKTLLCGHKCNGRCVDDCSKSKCKELVWVKPPCGHEDFTVHCWSKEISEALLKNCMERCNEVLKCGHRCSGTCGKCRQGRLHKKCNEKCERVLICGHICKSPCAKNCPPCDRNCENSCSHRSKCKHKCGSLCPPCRQRCSWSCPHAFCDNLCSENCKQLFMPCSRKLSCTHSCIGIDGWDCPKLCRICDRGTPEGNIFENESDGACFVQLSKCGHTFEAEGLYKHWLEEIRINETGDWSPKCPQCKDEVEQIPFDMFCLPDTGSFVHGCNRRNPRCGHSCIGVCGEDCPELCRICDKEEVEKIFFGNEDNPSARFIQLSDCKHVFEFSGLRQWICQENNESVAIQMKSCPKCKTIIRKSHVFNSEIQRCLADIESVKTKLIGSVENNSRKRSQLKTSILELSNELNRRVDSVSADLVYVLTIQEMFLNANKAMNVDLEKVANVIKIIESIKSLIEMESLFEDSEKDSVVFNDRINCVIRFLKLEFDNNEQQLFDITFELNLLKKYRSVLLIKRQKKDFRPEMADRIEKVIEMFHSIGRMSEEKCEQFEAMVNEVVKMSEISIDEKKIMLNAMDFGQWGHWFKCPNGHPYCITEYQGAMQTCKCPECSEKIGDGSSHQLFSTNTVASDFDETAMSAYDYSAQILPEAELVMFPNN